MNLFLTLAFLFFIGSLTGWILELLFRRFISTANSERKWINPGFCVGPYIPLYGVGLCSLFLIALIEPVLPSVPPIGRKLLLFFVMALCMTVLELITGSFCLGVLHVRLWDYSAEWGNFRGIICPKFSLIWAALGAVYYFLIHPRVLDALAWLSRNLAFSFVVGMFFGIFILDVVHSAQLVAKLRRIAEEYEVVVRYEQLKAHIRRRHEEARRPYHFFRPFHSDRPLSEIIRDKRSQLERRWKPK